MTDIEKFKSLLEYFISHVDWKQNMDKTHVGFSKYIKPLLDNNSFVESGQGYNGNKIQKLIGDWETINNHKIYLNIQPNYGDWSTRKCYLNWGNTGINIFCNWDKTKNVQGVDIGYAYWWETPVQYKTLLTKTIKELDLFNNGVSSELQKFYDFFVNEIINYDKKCGYYYQKEIENKYKMFINILTSNHNLILTGAPGTGKTYLAKQIAKSMGCTDNEIGFVQFHPSYDYTDFVEGLRPLQDDSGNVGFERKDGVFKEFCKKALKNFLDSKKDPAILSQQSTMKEKYECLISEIENGKINEIPLRSKNSKMLIDRISDYRNIILKAPDSISTRTYTVSLKRILKLSEKYPDKESLEKITNISTEIRNAIGGCNASAYWGVLNKIYEQTESVENTNQDEICEKKYVFIIDEINRGEISKIFGELFFSIDPGYRGTDGKVRTQYANMQKEEANDFDDVLGITDPENYGHFFVPENVYIIGTMNDIDRSVESMDFAFRRRFAFKEIKAIDRVEMLYDSNNGIENYADEAKERMSRLNEEIERIEGLSTAYHIGPAYFLKLKNYDGSFQDLWDNHLVGLLKEYMRGMQGVEDKIKTLKEAYNNPKATNTGDADENL